MNEPIRIVVLDADTLPPNVKLNPPSFVHEYVFHRRTSPEDVRSRIADADVVITNKVPIDRTALQGASRLKLVAVAATGCDVIDLDGCASHNITVSNIRGYATSSVPEHTFALILSLRRNILPYRQSVAAGRWQESGQFCYFDYPIGDLEGSVLGIIGDGVLGKAVADIARAYGMHVLFAAYKGVRGMGPLYTPFEEVLERSDIITLHCPLLPSTRNLIAGPEFARMAQRPLLINTARGGLVDEQALADALVTGKISGAGFDVVTTEPPPADHPFTALLGRSDFILTPHVAWASTNATQALADQLIDNIEAFYSGRPTNVVRSSLIRGF